MKKEKNTKDAHVSSVYIMIVQRTLDSVDRGNGIIGWECESTEVTIMVRLELCIINIKLSKEASFQ